MIILELSNFKQYKNINFKLEDHNLIYGSNGSGKTTIIDALELFFSEQHNLYGELINEAKSTKEALNIYQHYLSNKTSRHSSQHLSHFSSNKTAFEIKFIFLFNDQSYYIKKKYHHDGKITISSNIVNIVSSVTIIKKFFKYHFIYFKKPYINSHLSKGELAIKFLSSSLHELSEIIKTLEPANVIVAFDEPDNKIHPVILEPILNQIFSKNINSILTTTNIFTLEHYLKNNCNITLTYRTLENSKYISQTEQFLYSEFKSIENGELNEKIYSSSVFSSILPYKRFLLVEGSSDKKFFEALIHDKLKLEDIEVISIDGQDRFLSKEKLTPFLNLLRSMYSKNPLVYAIFDFDKDGIDYAEQFSKIIKKEHIYFINRKSYIELLSEYDESLSTLKESFISKSINTFVLEDYLKKQFKKPKVRKNVKPTDVVKELQKSISFNLNRLHISEEKLNSLMEEFKLWLPSQINIETDLYKNEQKNKFSSLFDVKKINEHNLKSSDYISLKKLLSDVLGKGSNKIDFRLQKCKKDPEDITILRTLKNSLQIPDYVLKINSITIEFMPFYNYHEFNNRSNEGVFSKELKQLLELLNIQN